jgi:hypothetical protein
MTRREALASAAAALGLGPTAGRSADVSAQQRFAATPPGAKVCILTPEAVEGPFYFDPKLVRADIAEGQPGAPLVLALQVVSATDCVGVKGARVDLWHADGQGMYSGYRGQGDDGISTRGQTFLRGTQLPMPRVKCASQHLSGWYPAARRISTSRCCSTRAPSPASSIFPTTFRAYLCERRALSAQSAARHDRNAEDFIFQDQGGVDTLVSVSRRAGPISASLIIGVAAVVTSARRTTSC